MRVTLEVWRANPKMTRSGCSFAPSVSARECEVGCDCAKKMSDIPKVEEVLILPCYPWTVVEEGLPLEVSWPVCEFVISTVHSYSSEDRCSFA